VVLRIWDVLLTGAQGVTSGQLLQPTSEFGNIKDLLELLGLLLDIFEVLIFDFPGSVLTRLTAATSLPTKKMPTND